MKRFFSFLIQIPEYILMAAVLFYWFSSSNLTNPVAIGLLFVLVLQSFWKNRFLGILISAILALTSCYMLLALFSELQEFPSFNADAQQLLFVGLTFLCTTLFTSGLLIVKTIGMKDNLAKLPQKGDF